MAEIPSHRELFETYKASVLLQTDRLSTRSFDAGFMPGIFAGASADLAEEAIADGIQLQQATFLRTAAGADLDRLVVDHFNLPRRDGQAAIGIARFSRPSTTPGPVLIAIGTRLSSPDGAQFVTTEEVLFSGTLIDIAIQASITGDAGIVDAGAVSEILDLLSDSTVSVTNLERTTGGVERETDEQYRERARGYLSTLRRGTKGAIEFGALSVGGVVRASLDESSFPPTLYISDASGGATTALILAVVTALPEFRAAGIPVNVVGAVVVDQPITLQFTFEAGVDTGAVRDQAIQAVVDAVNRLSIGDTLFRSLLISSAKIAGVRDVVVVIPAGDVAPAANQLLRTSRELVELG